MNRPPSRRDILTIGFAGVGIGVAGCNSNEPGETSETATNSESPASPAAETTAPGAETETPAETESETETPRGFETSGTPPTHAARVSELGFDSIDPSTGEIGPILSDDGMAVCAGIIDSGVVVFGIDPGLGILWEETFPEWKSLDEDGYTVGLAKTGPSEYVLAATPVEEEAIGLIRVDDAGHTAVRQRIDVGEFLEPIDVWVEGLPDGTYVLAWKWSGTHDAKTYVRKYDEADELQWKRTFNGLNLGRLHTGQQTGCTLEGHWVRQGPWISTLDTNGETVWTYQPESWDFYGSASVTDGYVLWGAKSDGGTVTGLRTRFLDQTGKRVWERTYDEPDESIDEMVETRDGDYRFFSGAYEGVWETKTTDDGHLTATTKYNVRPQERMNITSAERVGDTIFVSSTVSLDFPDREGWITTL